MTCIDCPSAFVQRPKCGQATSSLSVPGTRPQHTGPALDLPALCLMLCSLRSRGPGVALGGHWEQGVVA